MNNQTEPIEVLSEIRSLMERSSRFISLSGLSGVAAGTCALAGAAAMYVYLNQTPFSRRQLYYEAAVGRQKWGLGYEEFFVLVAALVFVLAFVSGVYFTTRKARRNGQKIWDALAQRMLVNLTIPLAAGGIFCVALYWHGAIGLVAPSTLIFYGLALINGGKYTLDDIRYLGMTEVALGLFGTFYPGYGLELWALGFGVLHVIYGIVMYLKYERVSK